VAHPHDKWRKRLCLCPKVPLHLPRPQVLLISSPLGAASLLHPVLDLLQLPNEEPVAEALLRLSPLGKRLLIPALSQRLLPSPLPPDLLLLNPLLLNPLPLGPQLVRRRS
jgi:hypothetical protein